MKKSLGPCHYWGVAPWRRAVTPGTTVVVVVVVVDVDVVVVVVCLVVCLFARLLVCLVYFFASLFFFVSLLRFVGCFIYKISLPNIFKQPCPPSRHLSGWDVLEELWWPTSGEDSWARAEDFVAKVRDGMPMERASGGVVRFFSFERKRWAW